MHVKLDTGMGRWGTAELSAPTRDVVGVMTHLATADGDLDFARRQVERFREATASLDGITKHVANSAAALRLPEARFDAARCGIAIYGLSPFGTDPVADALEPVLSWRSELAQVKLLKAGESTGYGRRFVAEADTWIGIVPVGYADGFRRDLTGTEVLVDGRRRRVVGTVSMDSVAVELDRALPAGTPVTIVGDGVLLEEHATRRRHDHLRARLRARPCSGASATRGRGNVSNADRRVERQVARAAELAALLDELLVLAGDERALDVGAGTGAFSFAIAPRVREVVAVEQDEELAERARADAPPNVEVLIGDGEHLTLDAYSFDLVGCLRVLHHTHRPELMVAELVRMTRPGGTILVADQLAPVDPLAAGELNRFEHARDPSTTRVLSDGDLRALFDANGLVLRREKVVHEQRDLDSYLDLAGCDGPERERAKSLAPTCCEGVVGWYVLARS